MGAFPPLHMFSLNFWSFLKSGVPSWIIDYGYSLVILGTNIKLMPLVNEKGQFSNLRVETVTQLLRIFSYMILENFKNQLSFSFRHTLSFFLCASKLYLQFTYDFVRQKNVLQEFNISRKPISKLQRLKYFSVYSIINP